MNLKNLTKDLKDENIQELGLLNSQITLACTSFSCIIRKYK